MFARLNVLSIPSVWLGQIKLYLCFMLHARKKIGFFLEYCDEFRMTLYKIINVSPIQEHPCQTRYGGAEQKKM
jgi:hypothetical protein